MEETDFCQVCGRKVPESQIAGICTDCGRKICSRCVVEQHGRLFCVDHAPIEPPPEPAPDTGSSGCFIATAAFGTPMAQEIQILRTMRDHHLRTRALGRGFTAWYYQVSPRIAQQIALSTTRRRVVRVFLQPLLRLAQRLG